jgi:hypothetical protein
VDELDAMTALKSASAVCKRKATRVNVLEANFMTGKGKARGIVSNYHHDNEWDRWFPDSVDYAVELDEGRAILLCQFLSL